MINIDNIIKGAETAEPIKLSKRDYSVDGYTAFGVYSVTMETLAKLGIKLEKALTSQQFYGFASSGKINGVKKASRFTEAEVEKFVARFVAAVMPKTPVVETTEAPKPEKTAAK